MTSSSTSTSPSSLSFNASSSSNTSSSSWWVEPHPDWAAARAVWGPAWPLHTYGVAGLYLLLALYAALIAAHLRKRLRYVPLVASTSLLLLLLALLKTLVLFIDPYCSRQRLGAGLVRVLDGLTYPFIISIFTLVEVNMMRITAPPPSAAQRPHSTPPPPRHDTRLLAALLVAHFVVVFSIYLTVALHSHLKLLILLSQAIFITWGLVLCFIFVYNAFRLVQFTNETGKVLEQIVQYTRVKRELSRDGISSTRDLALHRIRKARITRGRENEKLAYSEESHVSDVGESSDDSLCFVNEAHYELDQVNLERLYEERVSAGRVRRAERGRRWSGARGARCVDTAQCAHGHRLRGVQLSGSDSEFDVDMTSSLEDQLMSQLRHQYLHDNLLATLQGRSSSSSKAGGYQALWRAPPPTVLVNGVEQREEGRSSHVNEGYESRGVSATTSLTLSGPGHDETGERCVEDTSGYMADTEHTTSPRRQRAKHKVRSTSSSGGQCRGEEEEGERAASPVHSPYPLPIRADNALGLGRIRQGQVLRRVLKVSYVCTLCAFVCCVLQLYAMFGVFGVLSNVERARPWPWFIFMTATRLVELGLCWTCAWITHTLGAQRYRPARRRRRRRHRHTAPLSRHSTPC